MAQEGVVLVCHPQVLYRLVAAYIQGADDNLFARHDAGDSQIGLILFSFSRHAVPVHEQELGAEQADALGASFRGCASLRGGADVGVQGITVALGIHGLPVPVDSQQGLSAEELLLLGQILGQSALVRVDHGGPFAAVHDDAVAVLQLLHDPGHAEYGGQLQGPGQDGGVAGPAAYLGEDGCNVLLVQAHRHRGRQIMGYQHTACGQMAHIHAGDPQQDGQHPAADVPHIGGALAHELVIHSGEHLGVHGAHLIHRCLGALVGINDLLHLALHKGVAQHHDLAGEDLGFLFSHLCPDVLRHGGGLLVKLGDSCLEPIFLYLFASVFHGGVVQTLLPDADGLTDADPVRSGDAP